MKRERVAIVALLLVAVSNAMAAAALCFSGAPLCQTFWGYEGRGTLDRGDPDAHACVDRSYVLHRTGG